MRPLPLVLTMIPLASCAYEVSMKALSASIAITLFALSRAARFKDAAPQVRSLLPLGMAQPT